MVLATDFSLARAVSALSFPPGGATRTSGYRFEYNLHLNKIPSHVNHESIYSLVPRPFPSPVFEHLQYTKTRGKAWEI